MGFLYSILGLFLLVATVTYGGEYKYGHKEKKGYGDPKHDDYKKTRELPIVRWSLSILVA